MGLKGSIRVPSDKSITHRAFLFGAVAKGKTVVRNPLLGEDCRSTIQAIESLGASVVEQGETFVIEGTEQLTSARLDCGNSGTTMRLLAGLVAGYEGEFQLTGDDSLSKRPMKRVTVPLREMGAQIEGDFAPMTIHGRALQAIDYTLPIASAQVKSALLLAGLRASGVTTIHEPMLSRDHTERMLPMFGADLTVEEGQDGRFIRVAPGVLRGTEVDVPADPSSAAFLWAGAAIVPDSDVTTTDVCLNETRIGFLRTLQRMGADVTIENERKLGEETVGDVTVRTSRLQGTTVEGPMIPSQIDELPLFALVASQASTPSVVRDAAELRVKETDRIKTVVQELGVLGVDLEETEDGFIVKPSTIQEGKVQSHGDHRLSMMLQVARLLSKGWIEIEGIEASDISYPQFHEDLQRLHREIE
ncbi:3-phosphoshikimate 1-carboxyvinyltransferase [Exiguobacterium algae]|uniref:3-phosphoshikimate 1-carboxyvinyltransferase n=1 Tax=Exiguobacterium algae TaxID=2751250 RepID=UPI001BE544C1|nr:3-phosphoshikimate 1-carboxyvinyltransferase [Exiguobacterium algae]